LNSQNHKKNPKRKPKRVPNRITEDKARIIAAEYIHNKGDKVQTLLNCGYSQSYAKGSNGKKVFENVLIRAEIDRLQAKTELRTDISREKQLLDLEKVKTPEMLKKNPTAYVSAVREQNEMLGYHREKGLNPEKEAVKAAKMSAEERRLAEAAAKARTGEEAEEPKIKLTKVG
jgi:hypothetical protein